MNIPQFLRKGRTIISSDENDSVPSRIASTDKIIAALLLVFAIGLYASLLRDMQTVIGQFPKYPEAAIRFLQGGLDAERLLDFSPVYLGLCVLVAKFQSASFQSLFWIQICLVALTASGFFLILRRHFGRIISLCGALAFLLNTGVMVYAGVFEPEPVMMALLVLLVLFAGSRTPTGGLIAGVILTICLLTRPTVLLYALIVPIYFWLNLQGRQRSNVIAWFLFPVIIGIVFFAVKSISLTGSFPPPLMNPGTVFFEGNSPLASGAVVEYPTLVSELAAESPGRETDYHHAIYRLLARRATSTPLSQIQTNRVWSTGAVHFINDEPLHFIAQLTRKLFYIFHGYLWHDVTQAHVAESLLTKRFIPFVPLSLLSALAVCGLVVGLYRWKDFFLYYLVFFNQVAVMLITYTSERQRLSLLPFLILFAVVGLDWLLRCRPRPRLLPFLLLIPLAVFFSINSDLMRSNWRLWENYTRHKQMANETLWLRDERRFSEAAETLARSYAAAPWMGSLGIRPANLPVSSEGLTKMALREFSTVRGDDPDAHFDRAILLIETGELDAAEQSLTQLLQEGHSYYRGINRPSQPTYYLGRIAALRGRQVVAVEFMKTALSQAPGDPAILAQLAVLTNDKQFSAKLSRYFGEINALYYLALAHMENGHSAQAAEEFQRLLDKLPEYWKGQIHLAAALADSGRDEQAIATYLNAMQKQSGQVLWADKIIPAFRRRAELLPADDSAWFWYAATLAQCGFYLEARDVLKKSLAVTEKQDIRNALTDVEENIRRAGLSENEKVRPL